MFKILITTSMNIHTLSSVSSHAVAVHNVVVEFESKEAALSAVVEIERRRSSDVKYAAIPLF